MPTSQPARGRVAVNGIQLEYARLGQGRPLLVISPSWWPLEGWLVRVAEQLAPSFELLLFNHRGVGQSDEPGEGYTVPQFAADAAGLARALGYARVHVLGFAIGGATGLVLAREFPDLPLSLTVAAMGQPTPAERRAAALRHVEEEIARHGYRCYVRAHVDNDTTAFSPEFYRAHPEVAAALGEALERGVPSAELYLRHAEARASYALGDWVERLRVPTLVAVGAEDHVARGPSTPLHAARDLAARLPGARLRLFERARHLMPWESTEALAAELRAFTAEHGGAS